MSMLSLLAALALGSVPSPSPAAAPAGTVSPDAGPAGVTLSGATTSAAAPSSASAPEAAAGPSPVKAVAAAPVKAAPALPPLPAVPPGADGVPTKVERRRLLKQGHAFLTAGPAYLARGDYYRSPGLTGTVSYYPRETGGLELRLALFFSSLTGAGSEVFERTGLVPDAHKPGFLAAAGWRQSVGYGKALVGSSLTHLIHFDVQVAGHVGLTFTDRAVNPTLAVGPGLLVRSNTMFLQLDAPLVGSLEKRSRSSLALGMLPALTLGMQL